MAWFSPFTRDVIDLTPEEITPEPATRLTGIDPQKTRDSIVRGLSSSRERLAALEIEEARIQIETEHTRLAIAALEAAEKVMATGIREAEEHETDPGPASLTELPVPEDTTTVVLDTFQNHVGAQGKGERIARRVPRYARD